MIMIRNLNFSKSVLGAGVALVVLMGVGLLISTLTTEAQSSPTLGKGDRLDIQSRAANCSKQVWPYYEASCLRSTLPNVAGSVRMISIARP